MTHYSDNAKMVRVDFFKQSGEWYCTEAVEWTGGYLNRQVYDAFSDSLAKHFGDVIRHANMIAVCLDPYPDHSRPIMVHNVGEFLLYGLRDYGKESR